MREKEFYTIRIMEMIESISNVDWLSKIYSFVKVFSDDKEETR